MISQANVYLFLLILIETIILKSDAYSVAVFGGSGYVGRRVCRNLVEAGCDVISISRSGRPPTYYCDASTDLVSWEIFDLASDSNSPKLPKIDAAVSCIGNVNPDSERDLSTFFGLAFNDDRLYRENGILNENAARMAKEAGAERFIFLSVSYEVAKMVEGPLEGYMDGKRHAEHIAYELFPNDGAVVLGPSLIYGGKRFPRVGDAYRSFVQSPIAKVYVGGNESLRKLSSASMEDWVEKALFSPPVNVDVVGRVASAAALGLVKRDMVGDRKQGFFNSFGKSVTYDNVVFVDGTSELERIDVITRDSVTEMRGKKSPNASTSTQTSKDRGVEPPYEGALAGFRPYTFPLPVITFFLLVFYSILSGQFVGELH
uniref:NAD-dependent epimerase/dehydratase domain-containing protein n=2 Tax=Chaetoceros debilis TaxID=122233 RepID=A0A7S3PYA9_9STRA